MTGAVRLRARRAAHLALRQVRDLRGLRAPPGVSAVRHYVPAPVVLERCGAGRAHCNGLRVEGAPHHRRLRACLCACVCVCVCFVTIGLGHSSRFLCLPWRSPLLKLRARTGAAAVACAEPGRAPRLGTVAELLHERATGIQTHQPAAGGERITVVVHAARTWTAAKRDGPDRLELRLMMALIASGCVPFHCSCGTTWTVVQRDGPDHLDLLLNAGERVVLLWPGGARG